MKLVPSHYLNDGKPGNDGRPALLIKIEDQSDYDAILEHITTHGFYDGEYLHQNLGYRDQSPIKFDNLVLTMILSFLGPRAFLEIGCGKGDLVFLAWLDGQCKPRGMDISPEILATAPGEIFHLLDSGDFLELADGYRQKGEFFDVVCGFDIWEHLHPARLDQYIETMLGLSAPDALYFFIIPGFGEDRVFGEVFPLEFEENRVDFNASKPFSHLVAQVSEPPIPASGHLTWATSQWWEQLFTSHGLVRLAGMEKNLHLHLDRHLNRSQKSFYLFRRNTPEARQRARRLARYPLTKVKAYKLMRNLERKLDLYQRQSGEKEMVDRAKLVVARDMALEDALLSLEEKQRPWPVRLVWELKSRIPGGFREKAKNLLKL